MPLLFRAAQQVNRGTSFLFTIQARANWIRSRLLNKVNKPQSTPEENFHTRRVVTDFGEVSIPCR